MSALSLRESFSKESVTWRSIATSAVAVNRRRLACSNWHAQIGKDVETLSAAGASSNSVGIGTRAARHQTGSAFAATDMIV